MASHGGLAPSCSSGDVESGDRVDSDGLFAVDDERMDRRVYPTVAQDGPVTVALMFRVGTADESFVQRGITHLVEHLVLSVDQPTDLEWNGFVDMSRTVFHARGERASVARWLSDLTRSLSNLPLDRLDHERRVLDAESARLSAGAFDVALRLRYGLVGPGLAGSREMGLRRLTAEELCEWRDAYFTMRNSVMWSTVPLDDVELHLPEGAPRKLTLPAEVIVQTPAIAAADHPGLFMSAPVQRSTAMTAALRHLQRRAHQSLRYDAGVAYHVSAGYVPFTADVAFASLSADAIDEHLAQAQTLLLDTCDQIMKTGVTEDELQRDRADMARAAADPLSLNGKLDAAASSLLVGSDPLTDDQLRDELASLDSAEIADAARQWAYSCLLLTRSADPTPVGFTPYRQPDVRPVRGDRIRAKFTTRWDKETSLLLSPVGMTYHGAGDEQVVVRFDDCVGVLAWDDGSRALCERSGTWLFIDVVDWHDAARVKRHIERYGPKPFIPMGPEPERAPNWKRRRLWSLALQYAVMAAIFIALLAAYAVFRAGPNLLDG